MAQFETNNHDVLIVGGGGAGLRAAIAVAENNLKLSIAVVSKVYPIGGDLKRATAYTTADIQNFQTGSKPKQLEKRSRGFFTTWTDKVSPIHQLVIGDTGLSILLFVKIL